MSNQIEIYVSTDVEADGPIPGPYSMLSFGSAAYTGSKTLIGTYSANLETLPGASGYPKTMEWWSHHPEAYEATRKDPRPPEVVMKEYKDWLERLPGKPVFLGYPACFDFMFIHWYLIKFAGDSPFAHSALDIRSYAMALLRRGFKESAKRNMPSEWFDDVPHSHIALDDAIEQGALFCNMLAANQLIKDKI